jgi:hypothetical protein
MSTPTVFEAVDVRSDSLLARSTDWEAVEAASAAADPREDAPAILSLLVKCVTRSDRPNDAPICVRVADHPEAAAVGAALWGMRCDDPRIEVRNATFAEAVATCTRAQVGGDGA